MKRLTCTLIALCASSAWCAGATAQDAAARGAEVVHFEYGGDASEPGFWWARGTDEAILQFTNWTRVNASVRPERITGSTLGRMESLDRPFFIGNAIANLRGLDPAFGSRSLALADGRVPPAPPRPPAVPPREALNIAEALATLEPQNIGRYMPQLPRTPGNDSPPPRPIDLPDDMWLLKRDGTIIRPLRKTPVAGEQQYCAEGACESSYVYGFPLSAASEAVAVAFSRNGVVSTRRLDSLAGLAQ